MGVFKSTVERWRPLVTSECYRASSPELVNWLLSIIQQESGGVPGRQAYAKAGDGSYARGLTQVIGSVTKDYNAAHGTLYDHDEVMGGTSQAAAQIQIRVGLWLVRRKQSQVRAYLEARAASTAPSSLWRLADTAYAMGWGALQGKLQTLEAEGRPLTFDELEARFPTWGYSEAREKWINRPLHHANTIWTRYQAAEAESGHTAPAPFDEPSDSLGFDAPSILGLVGLAIAGAVLMWVMLR